MPPKKEDHPKMAMRAVQDMLKNLSVEYFGELEKENTRLLEDKKTTAIAQNHLEKRLVEHRGFVEQAKKRAESMTSDLASRERANKDLADGNATLRKQIKDEREAHEDVSKRLQRLESLSVKMLPVSEIPGLDALYHKARDFAEAAFGIDFPDDILRDGSLWKDFKNHEGSNDILFLRDNTQVAKQMRVAAALAILSRELSSSIFQGTYSMGQTTELSVLLNKIAETDPGAERHLRSVLLAATPQDLYNDNAEEWAWKSVESLFNIMKPPFKGSSDRNKLRDGLQEICDQALALWRTAQRVEEKITPDFELEYEDDEEYPVETLIFNHPTLAEPVGKKPQQNANSPPQANGTQVNGAGKKAQGNYNKTLPSAHVETTPPDPYVVVWPEFRANAKQLSSARVISQAQLNEAKKEDRESSYSKRGSRQRKRTMSKSESAGSPGGSNGDVSATSPTTSRPFLSRGAGGGHGND